MVVHSTHKGAIDPEDTLDLGGMRELKLAVDVPTVFDRPPVPDTAIDSSAIRLENGFLNRPAPRAASKTFDTAVS